MPFINKNDFKEHLCKDCKSKEYSVGFISHKICEAHCLTMKVLKKEKTYKIPKPKITNLKTSQCIGNCNQT